MARLARKKSKTGIYHVILRGINKQTIFYDDEDKEVFLNRIKLVKEKHDYDIYAFCFMSNHLHLLIKEKEVTIGEIMRKILSSYVYWYNSKYERIGCLFQDRYKSETIDDDSYLLCAVRYIHQNPVNAQIINDIEDYKWSSYSAYLNEQDNLIEKNFILSMFQNNEQFKDFMKIPEEKMFLEPNEKIRISDDKLLKEIKKELKLKEISQIYDLPRAELNKTINQILKIEGTNPYQISRVTGISMGIIRTILA